MKTSLLFAIGLLAQAAMSGNAFAATAPVITTQPNDKVLATRETLDLHSEASGTGITRSFRKGAAALPGTTGPGSETQANADYSVAQVTTSHAGIYQARFQNAGGTTDSRKVYVAIISGPNAFTHVKPGATITLTCDVTAPPGVTLAYQWMVGNTSQPVAATEDITGVDTRTLKQTRVGTAPGGAVTYQYHCRVTMTLPASEGGRVVTGRSNFGIINAASAPQIADPWNPAAVHVSQIVAEQVPAENLFTGLTYSYSATGLPPGITLNRGAGWLSGRATAARKDKNGVVIPYDVTFTVSSSFGSVIRKTTWSVMPMPDNLIGGYAGIVGRSGGINGNFGGACSLQVASTGAYSAALTLGSIKLNFKGAVTMTSASTWEIATMVPLVPATLGSVYVYVQNSSGTLTGYVEDSRFPIFTLTPYVGSGTAGIGDGGNPLGNVVNVPQGMAWDEREFRMLIVDRLNHRVCYRGDTMRTFVGSTTRESGFVDGIGTAARLNAPSGITIHTDGTLYLTEVGNQAVRKITPDGVVTTLAGNGSAGSTNGTGAAASFNNPSGITTDPLGNVYVCDMDNHVIRKITPAGLVSTFAGKVGAPGLVQGSGATARFNSPSGITYEPVTKCLYVCDGNNLLIRKVTLAGAVSAFVGVPGMDAVGEGLFATTRMRYVNQITADGHGSLYVSSVLGIHQILVNGLTRLCHRDSEYIIYHGLAVESGGHLCASQSGRHKVVRLTYNGPVLKAPLYMVSAPFTSRNLAPAGYVNYHTARLRHTAPVASHLPNGNGYLALTISSSGVVTWSGAHIDGGGFTGASFLGAQGELLLHSMLHKNHASWQLSAVINPANGEIDSTALVPADTYKVAINPPTTRTYDYGYDYGSNQILPLSLTGGRYAKTPPNVPGLLGVTSGQDNARFQFLSPAKAGPLFSQNVTVQPIGSLTLPPATFNINKVTCTLTASSGIFTGKYTLAATGEDPARSATFAGILVTRLGIGVGHHLLADPPTSELSANKTPIYSGAVDLTAQAP